MRKGFGQSDFSKGFTAMKHMVRRLVCLATGAGLSFGAFAAEPTAADYACEGLIAQFDGIENAGLGLPYDSGLYGWNDLSGNGKPLIEGFPAFIIEVKKADAATDDLKSLAREAREQIDSREYDATFRAEGVADIEKIGLSYFKNAVEICR